MSIFKKLDRIFFHSFLSRLEDKQEFLLSLKAKKLSVDDGLVVLEKVIAEEKKINIVI